MSVNENYIGLREIIYEFKGYDFISLCYCLKVFIKLYKRCNNFYMYYVLYIFRGRKLLYLRIM